MRNRRNRRWLFVLVVAWTFMTVALQRFHCQALELNDAKNVPQTKLIHNDNHHHHHYRQSQPKESPRNVFSPRMDYEQWTPLGRGDPLKNDPTYDYLPPVLDRVHYWIDPAVRKPDPSTTSDSSDSSSLTSSSDPSIFSKTKSKMPGERQKTEILLLGVSSKRPSTGLQHHLHHEPEQQPFADSRHDTFETHSHRTHSHLFISPTPPVFKKYPDSPAFSSPPPSSFNSLMNSNSNFNTMNYQQRIARPHFSTYFPHVVQGVKSKLKPDSSNIFYNKQQHPNSNRIEDQRQRVPYTMLMPPPMPPKRRPAIMTTTNTMALPSTTTEGGAVETSNTTKHHSNSNSNSNSDSASVTLQESNLVYHKSSVVGGGYNSVAKGEEEQGQWNEFVEPSASQFDWKFAHYNQTVSEMPHKKQSEEIENQGKLQQKEQEKIIQHEQEQTALRNDSYNTFGTSQSGTFNTVDVTREKILEFHLNETSLTTTNNYSSVGKNKLPNTKTKTMDASNTKFNPNSSINTDKSTVLLKVSSSSDGASLSSSASSLLQETGSRPFDDASKVMLYKGKVSDGDIDIASSYVNIGKAEAQVDPSDGFGTILGLVADGDELEASVKNESNLSPQIHNMQIIQPILTTIMQPPPIPSFTRPQENKVYAPKPNALIDLLKNEKEAPLLVTSQQKPQVANVTTTNIVKSSSILPLPVTYAKTNPAPFSFTTSLPPLHFKKHLTTTKSTPHLTPTIIPSIQEQPQYNVAVKDPNRKTNSASLRAPLPLAQPPIPQMYHVIIQGHSKVKTYGASKQLHGGKGGSSKIQETNEILSFGGNDDVESDKNTRNNKYIVKHLHDQLRAGGQEDKKEEQERHKGRQGRQGRSRSNNDLQTLKHVVKAGLGAIMFKGLGQEQEESNTEGEEYGFENTVMRTKDILKYANVGDYDDGNQEVDSVGVIKKSGKQIKIIVNNVDEEEGEELHTGEDSLGAMSEKNNNMAEQQRIEKKEETNNGSSTAEVGGITKLRNAEDFKIENQEEDRSENKLSGDNDQIHEAELSVKYAVSSRRESTSEKYYKGIVVAEKLDEKCRRGSCDKE